MRGNAVTTDHQGGSGRYSVAFDRDVSGCVATATSTDAQNGPTLETPPAGRITLGIDGSRVLVTTFAADGNVQDLRVRRARGLLRDQGLVITRTVRAADRRLMKLFETDAMVRAGLA